MFNKRGFTLIEMIIALVIIGIGVTGLLIAFSNNVRTSANPLISKQLVASAEEMMEEILLKPYTPNGVAPVNGPTLCGAGASRSAFDDIRDYNSYQTTGICDIDGNPVPGLNEVGATNPDTMTVTINIGAWQGIANTLQVTVTVTHRGNNFTLTNWRTP